MASWGGQGVRKYGVFAWLDLSELSFPFSVAGRKQFIKRNRQEGPYFLSLICQPLQYDEALGFPLGYGWEEDDARY